MGEAGPQERPTRTVKWWARNNSLPLVLLIVIFLAYSLPPYLGLDPSSSRIELNDEFPLGLHYPALVLHIAFGSIALLCLCVQSSRAIRMRKPKIHRMSGRLYVWAGVVPAAILVLTFLPFAVIRAGILGSTLASIFWVITALRGQKMARERRFAEHRRWMLYSAAFALQLIWGRIFVIGDFVLGLGIEPMLLAEAGGWLGWIINLLIVQWWLTRRAGTVSVPAASLRDDRVRSHA
jgi:uncharacterized membrane protein